MDDLSEKNYHFVAHDPYVRQDEVDFPFSTNINEVIHDSDALIIVTTHQFYRNLDLTHIKSLLKKSVNVTFLLLVNVITVLFPSNDFLITNLFVVKLLVFILLLFI